MNTKTQKRGGELLLECRVEKGLLQHELADALSMHQPSLSHYENGTYNIGVKVARRLGKYFNIDWLLFLPENIE